MIPKASQRAGGQQLATHLLNAIDNERVEVLALRGAVARDLHGAFAEWEAAASGTKCRKYLYSLSINPDPQQRKLSRQEMTEFIRRVETTLGLAHQPRAVVCHVKEGREHYHVAWSRIDTAKMKAVQLSHDRHKLRAAVLAFSREKGLELPSRMKTTIRERFNNRARPTLAEHQQQERTGITPAQRRREITEAWNRADSGKAFVAALAARGYMLARGDRRGHVIVDRHGEIHSLARQIEGVKTKQIAARLSDFPLERLPSAAEARKQRQRKISLQDHLRIQADQRRAALSRSQQDRRAALDRIRNGLEQRHRAERDALLSVQRDRNRRIADERRENEPRGLAAFLGKLTGLARRRKKRQHEKDAQRTEAQRENTGQLTRRQERERRELARHYRALGRVEKRELRSLETKLRLEFYAPKRQPVREAETTRLRPEFRDSAAPPAPPANTNSLISEEFRKALKARAGQKKQRKERDKDPSRDRNNGPR